MYLTEILDLVPHTDVTCLRPGDGSHAEMSLHPQGPLSEDLGAQEKVQVTVAVSTAEGLPQPCRKLP